MFFMVSTKNHGSLRGGEGNHAILGFPHDITWQTYIPGTHARCHILCIGMVACSALGALGASMSQTFIGSRLLPLYAFPYIVFAQCSITYKFVVLHGLPPLPAPAPT